MNKKMLTILSLITFFSNTTTFPLFFGEKRQEKAIRKELYAKASCGTIEAYQLTEAGLSLAEALERDLTIMENHKNAVQRKIDANKSFFIRTFIPAWNKFVAVDHCITSVTTGLFAVSTLSAFADAWQFKDSAGLRELDQFLGAVTKHMTWEQLQQYGEYYGQYLEMKYNYLCEIKPDLMAMVPFAPVAGLVSIVSAVWFVKKLRAISAYAGQVEAKLEKLKARLHKDQMVIVQLKKIQYEQSHNKA